MCGRRWRLRSCSRLSVLVSLVLTLVVLLQLAPSWKPHGPMTAQRAASGSAPAAGPSLLGAERRAAVGDRGAILQDPGEPAGWQPAAGGDALAASATNHQQQQHAAAAAAADPGNAVDAPPRPAAATVGGVRRAAAAAAPPEDEALHSDPRWPHPRPLGRHNSPARPRPRHFYERKMQPVRAVHRLDNGGVEMVRRLGERDIVVRPEAPAEAQGNHWRHGQHHRQRQPVNNVARGLQGEGVVAARGKSYRGFVRDSDGALRMRAPPPQRSAIDWQEPPLAADALPQRPPAASGLPAPATVPENLFLLVAVSTARQHFEARKVGEERGSRYGGGL